MEQKIKEASEEGKPGIPQPPIITMPDGSRQIDLTVHHRDARTGRITKVTPYKMRAVHGVQYFEYPIGSGNLWYKNGEEAGRAGDSGKVNPKAAHEVWERPLSADEKEAQKYSQLEQENKKLLLELEEVKREQKFSAIEKKAEEKQEK